MVPNVVIHEVGLRDGLQMEKQTVPTETKLLWIRQLFQSGVDIIQVGSFVHPEKVPQMGDTDLLFSELRREGDKPAHVVLSGLVLNEKGLERGMACGVEMFCMGVSASETHSRKNTGMSIAEATGRIIAMARRARDAGANVQVSVQSAFGCGYEGNVPEERVRGIVSRFIDAGLKNISLADTAGHAYPDKVEKMFGEILNEAHDIECACHFHNTYGLGLANCYAALKAGVRYFETSVAGLGGCPFTKIAGGNVCTEDFVHYFHRQEIRMDINLERLIALAGDISGFFGRELNGVIYKTGPIPGPPGEATVS
jgi:hydroxymethylglutaryl-CoA lyase